MKPASLSTSYTLAELQDVCASIVDGPFGSNLKTSDYVDSGIPVLQGKNITGNKFSWRDIRYVSTSKADELRRSHAALGDHLLIKIGSIGYSAIIDDLQGHAFAIIPANLIRLRTDSARIDSRYLHRVLTSRAYTTHFNAIASKTAQPALSLSKVKTTQIPLPALAQQKRIAAILDAADALRAKRRESIEQLDSLVQATFLEMFGECKRPPASIGPPSFGSRAGFVPLSQVATLATGHTPDRACDDYWGGSIPWISLTDIRTLDGRVALNTLQCVTESGLANSSSVLLPKGTVCLSRTASIGFVTVMGRDMATSQDFVNWICGPKINPIYLMTALRQSRPYLLSKSAGSTHKTIYYRHAEEMGVYLPPIDLQARFAAIVESIEQQKARLKAHLAELDTLFASLQSRAFNGELVA